jgi:anaerobic nitric oxide reductase transcription regulator
MKNAVITTHRLKALQALLPLLGDLTAQIPSQLRYQKVLDALRALIPSDAVALLRLDQGELIPVAAYGLAQDAMARRYPVAHHPRLKTIVESEGAVLFPPQCDLPDPYDGLIGSSALPVHDCMGCSLRINDRIWGVLTLDALTVGQFSNEDLQTIETFAMFAAATVVAASQFEELVRTVAGERKRAEAYKLSSRPSKPSMIGTSDPFKQLLSEIDLVAPSDLTVLVTGETGVGKELVAQRLHDLSARADKPYIAVNCAALPEHLVESELFGHVKGAFSGAIENRLGKFEVASTGTLFLDEIGELPLAVQATMLRVLQGGQLQRVGSDKTHVVDIRLIAATNRDLAEEVRAGRFRADLYHRLSVYPLRVPSLRERREDIMLLAGAFAEQNQWRVGVPSLRFSDAARRALVEYSWPGNIRELEHLMARAALKAKKRAAPSSGKSVLTLELQDLDLLESLPELESEDLGADLSLLPPEAGFRSAVDAYKRRILQNALKQSDGNAAAAARSLGLDRANLMRLAARLQITLSRDE